MAWGHIADGCWGQGSHCCSLPLQSALSPPMYRAPSLSAAMPVNAIPVGLNLCQQCGGSLLKKKEDSWREAEEND